MMSLKISDNTAWEPAWKVVDVVEKGSRIGQASCEGIDFMMFVFMGLPFQRGPAWASKFYLIRSVCEFTMAWQCLTEWKEDKLFEGESVFDRLGDFSSLVVSFTLIPFSLVEWELLSFGPLDMPLEFVTDAFHVIQSSFWFLGTLYKRRDDKTEASKHAADALFLGMECFMEELSPDWLFCPLGLYSGSVSIWMHLRSDKPKTD